MLLSRLLPTLFICLIQQASALPQRETLGANDFTTRQKAHEEWIHWARSNPTENLPKVADLYLVEKNPEIKARLYAVLKHTFTKRSRPSLGLSFTEEPFQREDGTSIMGMKAVRVAKDKSCHKAGLLAGDVITQIGTEKPLHTVKTAIPFLPIGEKVPFYIRRKGKPLILLVRIQPATETTEEIAEAQRKSEAKFKSWLDERRQAQHEHQTHNPNSTDKEPTTDH